MLTLGTLSSVILLAIGLGLYIVQTRSLTPTLEDSWILGRENLFHIVEVMLKALWSNRAYSFMASGILLLMFTQYLRVMASVIYIFMVKDWKYVGVTLTILPILTMSLLGYFNLQEGTSTRLTRKI